MVVCSSRHLRNAVSTHDHSEFTNHSVLMDRKGARSVLAANLMQPLGIVGFSLERAFTLHPHVRVCMRVCC